MTIETKTYRAGIMGELWADYEARVIRADAPKGQRREMKQSFIAGAVAYLAGEQAAANSADGPEDFGRLIAELDKEVVAMGVALVTENNDDPCQCMACRADRGEISAATANDDEDDEADIKVAVVAKGLNDEQKEALSSLVVAFVEEIGGVKPNGVTLQ